MKVVDLDNASPVRIPDRVHVHQGPMLLDGIEQGPGLAAHRAQYGVPRSFRLDHLVAVLQSIRLRGRGGAGFPFAAKLATTGEGRKAVIVVNVAEGEPASAKDCALATCRPHLILDGAVVAAQALRAREIHVVVPSERPRVIQAMRAAISERNDSTALTLHVAGETFVAGQSSAVIELLSTRANLPVTVTVPTAVDGHRGRPTLLSNAETWAHVGRLALTGPAAYATFGLPHEPGTTLLTLASTSSPPHVVEVPYGTPFADLLGSLDDDDAVLVGGFHGCWATGRMLRSATVSLDRLAELSLPLGAGVLLRIQPEECPVELTSRIVDYLASQSAGRCGPCINGLPAMALELRQLIDGPGDVTRVQDLARQVAGRGACAHPDGTVRLVRSLFEVFPAHVDQHALGRSRRCALGLAS